LENYRKNLKAETDMNEISFKKYLTDSTERIYSKIPLNEVKLNAYSGPEKSANI
jgi:hypothetical protein